MSEPTTRFNDYRAAVTQTIKDVMPDLNECEVQLGRFNLDELETNSIRTPAVRFGILRTKLNRAVMTRPMHAFPVPPLQLPRAKTVTMQPGRLPKRSAHFCAGTNVSALMTLALLKISISARF